MSEIIHRYNQRKKEASVETQLSDAKKLIFQLRKELRKAEKTISTMDLLLRVLVHKLGGCTVLTKEEMIHVGKSTHNVTDTETEDGVLLMEYSGHAPEPTNKARRVR